MLQKIKLEFTISKTYLQLAASFSQFYMHLKALNCAKKSLEYFNHLINNLQNILEDKSLSLDLSYDHNSENSRIIDKNPDLKCLFLNFVHPVKRIIEIIENLLKNIDSNNFDFNFKEKFDELIRVVIPEAQKKIDTGWMDEISITNFMHVEYIKHQVISSSIQFEELYSENFLSFIVMLGSVVLFTISTENRFLLIENINNSKDGSFKIKPIFEKTHQQRIRKMKRFILSDKVHSRAVYFLSSILGNNNLSFHMMNSYKKNYEYCKTLEEIVSSKAGS